MIQTNLEVFRDAYEREHAVTRKVLLAFPHDQPEFRPHERSTPALQLAWTFCLEENMMLKALRSEPVIGSAFPPPPTSWQQVLDAFHAQHHEISALLGRTKEDDLAPVRFYSGPKEMREYPAVEFLWFMLFDQVHHRGQLSVYVRMTGGKVPSIYGPSADEPWT